LQVIVNGKPAKGLDAKLEGRVTARREADIAEGFVLSADAIVIAAERRMKLIYGVAGGVAGVIALVILIGGSFSEPSVLIIALPVAVVGAIGIGWLMAFMYRRNMAKARARIGPALAHLPSPGTTVRADQAGLSVGGHIEPWSAFTIETLDILDVRSEDAD
jgi:hypothetical protein